jgi:lipopolysaccharide transport system permease protein
MSANPRLTVVERGGGTVAAYLRDVFGFRDALQFMVRRDVKVRYAQTVLGFGWAVLQPLTQVVVFSVFFGNLAGVASGGVPYPVFSIAGVVPWTYFSVAALAGSTSLIGTNALVSKIYVPRVLMPLTPILASLLDFLIGIGLLLAVLAGYGRTPPATAFLYLPCLVLAAVLASLAVAIWLAPLAVQYRDVRYVAPFLIQTLMFVTPVIYPSTYVPASLRGLYSLNPMVGVVSGFRAAFLEIGSMPWGAIGLSYLVSATLVAAGLAYFRRAERIFADIA